MEKGSLKIRTTGMLVFLYCLLALSASMIVYMIVRVDAIIQQQSKNYSDHGSYLRANSLFREGTDLLTEKVRRYVVSDGDVSFMKQYFDEAEAGRRRDRAIEMVADLPIDQALKNTLTDAMKYSKDLMDTEYYAMHLVSFGNESAHRLLHEKIGEKEETLPVGDRELSHSERMKLAEDLLWGELYNSHKTKIYEHLEGGLDMAVEHGEARNKQLRRKLFQTLALGAINLVVLVLSVCGILFYRRYQHSRIIELQAEENARMNVQLRAERDKALRAEKSRSYFFSTVSHDIRTPLNSIIGFSEMLQLGIDDPKEQEKALDAIITSGQTLLELINDVLDLSKLESGKMELRPVPTDVASLVEKVTNSFEVAASRSSVPIRTEIGKMPFLKLDPQRIRQILFNLIGNAVKFTAHGVITVRAAYENGTFTLAVDDTGCGISEENIKKLMSPYVQLQEHDSTKGTGLGLAICKQLAIQMKGRLELESTLGSGSTFTLVVPNVQAFSDQESEAYVSEHCAPKQVSPLTDEIKQKRILVVDDQILNQRILQTMLNRLGIGSVLTAENGRAALETLKNAGGADIVLTDMTMPVLDGAGLVREMREDPKLAAIPVYVITADVEMQNAYKEIGFDEMLIKPVTLEKLQELLVKYAPHRVETTGGKAAEA